MKKRIGVFAGTFDPVHSGHLAFALQALETAKLDKVYFLPERRPRDKQGVEHFAHRVAMIKQAIKPHPQFKVLELDEVSFSAKVTLPKLKAKFRGDTLVLLFGSDLITHISNWPNASELISGSELVVGLRNNDGPKVIEQLIRSWGFQPKNKYLVNSFEAGVSSGKIRHALRQGKYTKGVLQSVKKYSNKHWLYISLLFDKT